MFNNGYALPAQLNARLSSDSAEASMGGVRDLLLNAYVPGLRALNIVPENPEISLDHTEAALPRLEISEAHLKWFDLWKERAVYDLHHLFYSVARLKLLERGLYSVHAASVGGDEQLLIIGHSGAGKTTAALELVRQCNQKLASGNKTVVEFGPKNSMHIAGGTPTITMREDKGENYASTLGKDVTTYGKRIAFSLDKDHYVLISKQPVRGIVLVRHQDGVREANQLENSAALHTLYPYFMDSVNADAIVCGGKAVFSGAASQAARENLATQLSCAVTKIPVYSVVGSIPFVVDTLKEL